MSLEEILPYIALQRIVERSVIFLFIIVLAIVLLVVYRKTIQRVNFDVSFDKVGAAAATTFAMPIFLLLVLVGFSYVLFSQPISLEANGNSIKVRHATSMADKSTIDRKLLMSALAVHSEFFSEVEVDDEAKRRRIGSANRILDLFFGELVDAEFGDDAYGFYIETKAKLASVPSITDLDLTADKADLYQAIDSLFDGSEIFEER